MRVSAVVAAIAALGIVTAASAQVPDPRPGPSTPVEVMNSTANPVPVSIQGSSTVTVNSSPDNPLIVDGVVDSLSIDQTRTLFQQIITVDTPNSGNHVVGPIDVKGYRSVRVAVERGSCAPCGDPVRVHVRAHGVADVFPLSAQIDSFLVNTEAEGIGFFATRVYEVPGERLTLSFANPASGARNSVHITVFGRAN